MADKEEVVKSKRSGRLDLVTIGLPPATALASTGGFLLLFSMWWRTEVTEPESRLRLTSREFVDGRLIVASKLPELAELDPPDSPVESLELSSGMPGEDIETQRMIEESEQS